MEKPVKIQRKFGQAIALNIVGIKCDNQPICSWRDDSVRFAEYDKWLNRPCPRCGSNLLTPEDMTTCKTMQTIVSVINFVSWPVVAIYDTVQWLVGAQDKAVLMRGEMNGSGAINFKPEK